MPKLLRLPLALAALAALAGCAASRGDYPSLAVRDIERVSGTMLVAPSPPPPPPAQPSPSELGAIAAAARAAQAEFASLAPAARGSVAAASGQGQGSENWSLAQIAVAELEARRGRTMIALADLDRLYVAASSEGRDLAQISAVRDEVEAIVNQQDATIDSLLGGLSS